jgi:hypothetical protein
MSQAFRTYLPFVYRIADGFSGRPDDEFRSEAHMALLAAVGDYKPDLGTLEDWITRKTQNYLQRLTRTREKRNARETPVSTFTFEKHPASRSAGVLDDLIGLEAVGSLAS